MKHKVKL